MSVRAQNFFNAVKAGRSPKDQKVGDVTLAWSDGCIQAWVKLSKLDGPVPSCFLFTPSHYKTAKQFLKDLNQLLAQHGLKGT